MTTVEDYLWFQQNDKAALKRANLLISAIQCQPFEEIGKPEPLKHNLSGAWSRRITAEHRLVYVINEAEICIISCRYHY
ncbi:Txe/YoeB family addiction module toxin [Pseudomonas syringae]|nr:Txe/YoeB family addiction module toxin [Pseudomonas syringae]MCF5068272.1 Txe/YoeB family addiction module toxin [Pseudomonas syringae]